MASQITHVVYGKKIFDRLDEGLNWSEFVIGTTFPDIRYLAKIDRNKLHYFNTSEGKIPKDNSFKAGLYTHSLVDEKREDFIEAEGVYEFVSRDWTGASACKLIEDEVLYDKYKQWKQLLKTFDNPSKEEFKLVSDRKAVERWHKFLLDYFKEKPTEEAWYKAIVLITSDESMAKKVIEETSRIKRNGRAMDIIKKTYENI